MDHTSDCQNSGAVASPSAPPEYEGIRVQVGFLRNGPQQQWAAPGALRRGWHRGKRAAGAWKADLGRAGVRWGVLALLASAYMLQTLSPLRINNDAITLLSMAASAADGEGFVRDGRPTQFPPGYPALVVVLDWAGLAASWSLIALNLAFLFLGIAASYYILRRSHLLAARWAAMAGCLTLLSFAFVKYVTLPITDVVFFGVALSALAALVWAEGRAETLPREAVLGLGAAGLLILAAISVRTVGIALLAPALWLTVQLVRGPGHRREHSEPKILQVKGRDALLLVLGMIAILVTALYVVRTRYFEMITRLYREYGVMQVAWWNVPMKLVDCGELMLNIPLAKAAGWLPEARPIWMAVGMVGFFFLVYGLWLRRHRFGVVEVYVLAYSGILALWVSRDVRFWIPLIPILVGLGLYAVRRLARRRPMRLLLGAYLVWFVTTGLGALAYSTRISLAGAEFPRLFGDGSLRASYELVMWGHTREPDQVQETAVRLLERYGEFGNRNH